MALLQQAVHGILGWVFREQTTGDFGIDGQIEIVKEGQATGLLIACQIKAGPSFLEEEDEVGFVYRGKIEHLNYWLIHCLPVILVLCDLDQQTCYWQQITDRTAVPISEDTWKVTVPKSQILDPTSRTLLEPIAERVLQWKMRHPDWSDAPSYIGPLLNIRLAATDETTVLARELPERARQDTLNISEPPAPLPFDAPTALQKAIDSQLAAAKRHIDDGRYETGWEVLEAASEFDPLVWTSDQRFAWSTRKGCCHLAFNRPEEAKECFASALALRPDFPTAITNLIIARDLCGDSPVESLRLLEPVLEANPGLPEAVHTKANLLLTLGEAKQAVALLEQQAEERQDTDIRRDYALANAYRCAGQLERAEAQARKCLLQEPNAPEALELLGDTLLTRAIFTPDGDDLAATPLGEVVIERARLAEAATAFNDAATRYEATGRDATASRCRVNFGVCQLELGDRVSARGVYEQVQSAAPPANVAAAAMRGLARIALEDGHFKKAISYFRAALELDPDDLPTQYNFALALASNSDWDEVTERIDALRVTDKLPEDLQVDLEVLSARVIRHRVSAGELGAAEAEKAQSILADAALRFPTAWQVSLEQMQWSRYFGEHEHAMGAMAGALDQAPDNLLVLEIATSFLLEQKEWEQFTTVARRLIQQTREAGRSNRSTTYHNCAVALVQLGRPGEALAVIDSAEGESFPSEDLLEIRASALRRLYRFTEARDCWRRMLSAKPDYLPALVGLADIEWATYNLYEAYAHLQRAEALGDRDALAYVNLMTVARELGERGEAVRWAEAAIEAGGDLSPEMLMGAISAAREAPRWDLTSKWIELFRSQWPDSNLIWTQDAPSRQERDARLAAYEAVREEQIRLAWLAYEYMPVPLTRLSQETGLPLPLLWEQIIQDDEGKYEIRCHLGSADDHAAQEESASRTEVVSVDLTALLTLELLGQLYLLPRMYRKIVLPEYFFLSLRNSLARIHEPQTRLRVRRIIEFLAHHPTVERVDAALVDDEAEQPAEDTGGLAEQVIPMLTDEAALQHAIRQQGGQAFSTYGLLGAARSKGLIGEEEYRRCQRALFAHGYVALPIKPLDIDSAIRDDPRPTNRAARRMLQRLIRGDIDYDRVGKSLAGVLGLIGTDWRIGHEDLREPWIDFILAAASTNDPDQFRLQQTAYYCTRMLCERLDEATTPKFIHQLLAWFRSNRLDVTVLARGLGHAARDHARKPRAIKELVCVLTSACSRSFQQKARLEALPPLGC